MANENVNVKQGNGGQPPKQNENTAGQSQCAYKGSNDITVEMANSRLGPVLFGPLKIQLRSRFQKGNLTTDEHVPLTSMHPDQIPGQRITLKIRERMGIISDPLELPEYKDMLDRITLANKTNSPTGAQAGFYPKQTFEGLSNSDIKTWLYEIRKLLDHPYWYNVAWRDNPRTRMGGPMAILIEGNIPTRQEIEQLPFDLKCNFFTNSQVEMRVRKVVSPEVAKQEANLWQ